MDGLVRLNGGSELIISDVGSANNVVRVFVNINLAALLTARLTFGNETAGQPLLPLAR